MQSYQLQYSVLCLKNINQDLISLEITSSDYFNQNMFCVFQKYPTQQYFLRINNQFQIQQQEGSKAKMKVEEQEAAYEEAYGNFVKGKHYFLLLNLNKNTVKFQ
eukprot:TRINITY_DN7027_c1_g1_i1.p4 TRINITY_DN7027_c1_g1~~TRINITY_DN7027_c1_g1_i1.p4  ORF type:complete len:104 (+),score=4.54 TRINITY_DN7027_c1_g1_i1:412-723(+)